MSGDPFASYPIPFLPPFRGKKGMGYGVMPFSGVKRVKGCNVKRRLNKSDVTMAVTLSPLSRVTKEYFFAPFRGKESKGVTRSKGDTFLP